MKSGIGRREFLGGLTGAALAFGLESNTAEAQESVKKQSGELLDYIRQISYDRQSTKVEFSHEIKEIPQNIKEVLKAIGKYNQDRGLGAMKELWQSFSSVFDGLNNFDEKEFYNFLYSKLPDLLSPYGVFCDLSIGANVDEKGGLNRYLVRVGLFGVDKMESDEVKIPEGKDLKRDILYVNPLNIDGENLGIASTDAAFKTDQQNIIVYNSRVDERVKKEGEGFNDIKRDAIAISDNDLIEDLNYNHERQDQLVPQALFNRLVRDDNREYDRSRLLSSGIKHETGHLIDFSDPARNQELASGLSLGGIRNSGDNLKYKLRASRYRETFGRIAEISDGSDGRLFLCSIILSRQNKSQDTLSINLSDNDIFSQIVRQLTNDYKGYGLQYDPKSKLSKENQIIFQIADIIDDEDKMRRLYKKLLEVFKQPGYLKYILNQEIIVEDDKQLKPQRTIIKSQDKHTDSQNDSTATKCLIGLASAGAAVGGLVYKLYRRKNKISLESDNREAKKFKNKKKRKRKKR